MSTQISPHAYPAYASGVRGRPGNRRRIDLQYHSVYIGDGPKLDLLIDKEVFNSVYVQLLEDPTEYQFLYGGAGSGKSVFGIGQRPVLDIIKYDRNYLCLRKVQATQRESTFAEMRKWISTFGLSAYFDVTSSPMGITCIPTRKQILFRGLDDVEKLKSVVPLTGPITDVIFEEATEITEDDYEQAELRMRGASMGVAKRKTFCFNPINERHWINRRFLKGQKPALGEVLRFVAADGAQCLALRTNYKHNKFLTEQDVAVITRKSGYYAQVYANAEWGSISGAIFTNWRIEDLSAIEESFQRPRFGLDFGYGPDPAAHVKCGVIGNTIYVFREIGGHGWTNPYLATMIRPICGRNTVWCDSAEPKSIRELQEVGISAYPVQKRRVLNQISGDRSSVLFQIQWIQEREVVVDKSCVKLQEELSTWQWKKNHRTGEQMAEPEDGNDHYIAALRYALEDLMLGPTIIIGGGEKEKVSK